MNNHWIPINKKTPDNQRHVLVAVTYKNDERNIPCQIRVGEWRGSWVIQTWSGSHSLKVTHWKELPKLPI